MLELRFLHRFVRLFTILSQCSGKPMAANQNLMHEMFFVQHPEMVLRPQTDSVLAVPYQSGLTLDLHQLKKKLVEDPQLLTKNLQSLSTNERLFRYHLQVMRCLAALCGGRNRLVIDWVLTQELSDQVTTHCTENHEPVTSVLAGRASSG